MNKLWCMVAFLVGGATGAGITWKILDKKYEERIQEEVASVKESFDNLKKGLKQQSDISKEETKKDEEPSNDAKKVSEDKEEVEEIIGKHSYNMFYADNESVMVGDVPYIISAEEFGEYYDYETITLTYYSADGTLVDDDDEIVDDIDGTIGHAALASFGEDSVVYVRNDQTKCDYEVLWDDGEYQETTNPNWG